MAESEEGTATVDIQPDIKREYSETIRPELKEKLNLDNINAVPRLNKITVNMGIGDANEEREKLTQAREDLAKITAQQPIVTRANRAISEFNIRKGDPVGLKVTLRGNRMYAFLERLIKIVIPRIKDFRGLNPRSMDNQGNFSMGISEQATFPEINIDQVSYPQGMDICFSTSAKNAHQGLMLLKELGMPFQEL